MSNIQSFARLQDGGADNQGDYMFTARLVAAAVMAAATLTGCTAASATPTPAPAVTTTVTATPASCLLALDEADKLVAIFADTMTIVGDTFDAIADLDLDGMQDGVDAIEEQSAKVSDIRYAEYRDDCKAGR